MKRPIKAVIATDGQGSEVRLANQRPAKRRHTELSEGCKDMFLKEDGGVVDLIHADWRNPELGLPDYASNRTTFTKQSLAAKGPFPGLIT